MPICTELCLLFLREHRATLPPRQRGNNTNLWYRWDQSAFRNADDTNKSDDEKNKDTVDDASNDTRTQPEKQRGSTIWWSAEGDDHDSRRTRMAEASVGQLSTSCVVDVSARTVRPSSRKGRRADREYQKLLLIRHCRTF